MYTYCACRAGGTQRLTKLIGPSKAKELIFTAQALDNKRAHEYGMGVCWMLEVAGIDKYIVGIVNYAAEDNAYDRAVTLAESILPQAPLALRAAKMAVDRGAMMDMWVLKSSKEKRRVCWHWNQWFIRDAGLEIEQAYYAQIIPTEDRLEGLRAFKEKRKPVYKGR